MKANFKLKRGAMTFEVLGEQAKDIWAQVAQIQELFEAESCCGLCGSEELRYSHRITKNGGYHYYELICRECYGVFQFGQVKATLEIFPKRRDTKTKQPLPNGGWRKWEERGADPEEGNYAEAPPQQAPPSRAPAPQATRQAPPQQQGQRPPAQAAPVAERTYEHEEYPPMGDEPPPRGRGGERW